MPADGGEEVAEADGAGAEAAEDEAEEEEEAAAAALLIVAAADCDSDFEGFAGVLAGAVAVTGVDVGLVS